MLFFPLMSQGFVQTANALYGLRQETGFRPIVPFMSFMFGAWALLLLLFFFRRHDTELELAAKLAGVAASTIAVVKYDLIVAVAVRYLGSGAGETSVALLIGLSVFAVIILLSRGVRNFLAGSLPEAGKTPSSS
jgi:surface polysaccharide O-acyltransferase-like enzyme